MTTPAALARALAYVEITDSKSYLHTSTRSALFDYVGYAPDFPKNAVRFYVLTPEGRALAEGSALWAAHQKLVALGFRLRGAESRRKQKPGMLSYVHREDVRRTAFISGGSPYAMAAPDAVPEGRKAWEHFAL
jgi:hypothetical protein